MPSTWFKVVGSLALGLLAMGASNGQAQMPPSPRDLIDDFSLELGSPAPALPMPAMVPTRPASGMVAVLPPPPSTPPQPAWQALRTSEAALAELLRQSIRGSPNDPQLTAPDTAGRTPLMQAALYGYADIVDALLTSPGVRADLEHRDAFGATAWQLAQFARPLTLLTCHSLYLATEMEPLWRAQQWRAGYFQRGQETAFHAISRSLLAAGATPDTDGARAAWRRQCPEREEIVDTTVDTAPDLLKALLALQTTRAGRWDQRWNDPLVAPPGTVLRIGLPQPLPGNSIRMASGEQVCSHLPAPEPPAVNWAGRVVLRTTGRLEAGRVIVTAARAIEATDGIDRPTLRRLRQAINQALAQYRCRGDHLFEQEFEFKFE